MESPISDWDPVEDYETVWEIFWWCRKCVLWRLVDDERVRNNSMVLEEGPFCVFDQPDSVVFDTINIPLSNAMSTPRDMRSVYKLPLGIRVWQEALNLSNRPISNRIRPGIDEQRHRRYENLIWIEIMQHTIKYITKIIIVAFKPTKKEHEENI